MEVDSVELAVDNVEVGAAEGVDPEVEAVFVPLCEETPLRAQAFVELADIVVCSVVCSVVAEASQAVIVRHFVEVTVINFEDIEDPVGVK